MNNTAAYLLETIDACFRMLQQISSEEASLKPVPGKWSKKELIGHLIDSATNNHQKFLRTMQEDGIHFPPYQQDEWIGLQHYHDADWFSLIVFWKYYNLHLAHIMDYIDKKLLHHKIFIGASGPFTLEFIVKDYVEHLKHHMMAILPDAKFLSSDFKMVY